MDIRITPRRPVRCVVCGAGVHENSARVIATRVVGTSAADVWRCFDCERKTALADNDLLERFGRQWG